jgi:hypothetical protein
LIDENKGPAGNPWRLSFMAMYHMANDSDLFKAIKQLGADGCKRVSKSWVFSCGADCHLSRLRNMRTQALILNRDIA